jgi:hypothetical protein
MSYLPAGIKATPEALALFGLIDDKEYLRLTFGYGPQSDRMPPPKDNSNYRKPRKKAAAPPG